MENGPSTSSGYWNGEWPFDKLRVLEWRMENGPSTSSGYWNGEMENGEWRMENGEIRN